MVVTAAAADGVPFEGAQAGRGLAGVGDACAGARDGVDVAAGEGGDAAHPLHEVEPGPLRGQHAAGGARDAREHRAGGEPVAVRSDGLAQTGADTVISLSAKTGAGLDLLKHALLQEVGWQGESESLFLARSRHLNALHEAEAELENAALCDNNQIELFAEHLRLAQNACSEITGEFTADDLLGVIFSRFCIGK